MAEHGHGHSVAAWTAVAVILVGAAVASVAVVIPSMLVGVIGVVIMAAGVVAGKVLSSMGYGQAKPERSRGTTAVR